MSKKFHGRYGDLTSIKHYELIPPVLNAILVDDNIQRHPPLMALHRFVTLVLKWTLLTKLTFYIIVLGFHLQQMRHANRGRLILWTPGPDSLWDLH